MVVNQHEHAFPNSAKAWPADCRDAAEDRLRPADPLRSEDIGDGVSIPLVSVRPSFHESSPVFNRGPAGRRKQQGLSGKARVIRGVRPDW
jgi:hypothetical protein